ncbi:hypothetical protein [Actinoplanes sp. NPDC049681]|uniref:hypothetical protein n=1 Tax=Actinoplanes sp. NPDC049681 TaxID=3363905 RepID=UPI0037A94D37
MVLTALETRLRFQTVPLPQARALPTANGLGAERTWLRSTFSRQYDAAAATVSRVLARHPGFHAAPETLVDAAAVHLYLSAFGVGLPAALRRGEPGPHVPFGRCVSAGLERLPSYRGAAGLRAVLNAGEIREIREHGILRDWAFTEALIEPPADLPGTADVLVWSMTARRTRLLEPHDENRADHRVVFLPGTSFKVLEAAEPGPGRRGRLVLRELSPDERDRGHVAFDDLTVPSLHRAAAQWGGPGSARPGVAAVPRFSAVPGLR